MLAVLLSAERHVMVPIASLSPEWSASIFAVNLRTQHRQIFPTEATARPPDVSS